MRDVFRSLTVWLAMASALLLGACVGPHTTPATGITGCKPFLHEAETGAITLNSGSDLNPLARSIHKAVQAKGEEPRLNILVLSGGGKYGAYGAGFMQGWTEAEKSENFGNDEMRRQEIDIITGVSTGGLLATFITAGNRYGPDDPKRAEADAAAIASYQTSDAELFKEYSELRSLGSNALTDIEGRLDKKVDEMIENSKKDLVALPDSKAILIGLANLTNGKFYIADLVQIAKAGAWGCYREVILASAAVPVQFPPRFIDGHPYVDGGVRFGAMIGQMLGEVKERSKLHGDVVPVVRVIINGTQSANSPSPDIDLNRSKGRFAMIPSECDASNLDTIDAKCGTFPDKHNRLLWIAKRSAGDIMQNQLYRDSVYRIHAEMALSAYRRQTRMLEDNPGIELDPLEEPNVKYSFVSNKRIEENKCEFDPAGKGENFDRKFMSCLIEIGKKTGSAQIRWESIDAVPHNVVDPQSAPKDFDDYGD